MSVTEKKIENEKIRGHAIVSDRVKSYADDPYFIKKAEEASQTLKRVGLPGENKNQPIDNNR